MQQNVWNICISMPSESSAGLYPMPCIPQWVQSLLNPTQLPVSKLKDWSPAVFYVKGNPVDFTSIKTQDKGTGYAPVVMSQPRFRCHELISKLPESAMIDTIESLEEAWDFYRPTEMDQIRALPPIPQILVADNVGTIESPSIDFDED